MLFESPINILEVLRINELSYGECHLPFFCSIDTHSHYAEGFAGSIYMLKRDFSKAICKKTL